MSKKKYKYNINGSIVWVPKGFHTTLHAIPGIGLTGPMYTGTQAHKEIEEMMERHRKEMIHRNYKHHRWNKWFSFYLGGLGSFMYTSAMLRWYALVGTNWIGLFNCMLGVAYIGWSIILYRYSKRKIKELFIDAI